MLAGEGLERHVGSIASPDQQQWRQMGLEIQVQRRQQVCCSALVSPRWSFLAPEGCGTLTGITPRRQDGSFEPGLGTSVGGIKPVLYEEHVRAVGCMGRLRLNRGEEVKRKLSEPTIRMLPSNAQSGIQTETLYTDRHPAAETLYTGTLL